MVKRARLLALLLLLPSLPAAAEELSFASVRIDGVQRVDRAAVEAVITTRAREPVTAETIDADLRAIYALGHFDDVRAEQRDSDGVAQLVYHVSERPLVRRISIRGNDKLKVSQVRGVVTLRTPGILKTQDLQASETAIRQLYTNEGYYAAEVSSQVEMQGKNEATVFFDIVEGPKVTIDNIHFEGNRVFSDRKLRKFMQTKRWWIFSWLTSSGTYNEEMLQNDLELIKEEYFNKGYVRVKVKQPHIQLSDDRSEMDIYIEIEEGESYSTGQLSLKGDLLESEEVLLKGVQLRTGETFSRELLRKSIKNLNDFYADRGYAYVNVTPLTQIDDDSRSVAVAFTIEQGVQVHIDRIEIGGNSKTRDKVVRREMVLVEGDLYSANRLETSRKRINNLGFFSEVNVDAVAHPDDPTRMDVHVDVKEQPTGTFSVGFGYSSTDGFIGQGSISQDNFLGNAWRLNLAASIGGDYNNYRIGLLDPYFLDRNLALGFDLYKTDREWDEYDVETTGGQIKLGVPLSYENRLFFVYKYEQKEIYDVDPWSSVYIRSQEGRSTVSSLYASISRNTTDFRPDPSRGYMSEFSVEYAGLGGTERFVKTIADHRHFFPLMWDWVFSPHGQIGYLTEIGGQELPLDERFYLGGINTMRGFDTREVGPWQPRGYPQYDESGNLIGYAPSETERDYIGGVKVAFFNFELIFPLLKDAGLKGVLFVDVGNAWGEGEEYFSDMRYSAGAGIRWNSPLGPLRLEWGYNLDPYDYEDKSKFDFSIGKFF
ncbi:MAG: outer membrane protein assembly factor BamA [Desulfuromonas sp.]|nr:outer membrane protein assembly factor BamA [Desulfuromonas thiophila]MDD3802204.1 outer membrane protein assembly factor BamA [Desulfuromonas thiophila]